MSLSDIPKAALGAIPGVGSSDPAPGELPSASLAENTRFNALVVIPNALQGLFRKRRPAVAAATRANLDKHAVGLLAGMSRSYDGGPVWVRIVKDPALLLLDPGDVRTALEGSPDPFASDPDAKRKGMAHFQPDALTISRGEEWRNRRRFAEAVLDTASPRHRLAARFSEIAVEEVETSLAELGSSPLEFDPINRLFRRITRRVVLGDSARDDERVSELLSELMGEANAMPSKPSPLLDELLDLIAAYAEKGEEGSLAGLIAEAPHDETTKAPRQLTHWLFAMGDTLPINVLRALALLAARPDEATRAGEEPDYAQACLQEAMRLWPTTPMLSRITLAETELNGAKVPEGTQILFVNTYLHRDRDRIPYADRFAPVEWLEGGSAPGNWSFNHFSNGPQGCPGAGISLDLGAEAITAVLTRRSLTLEQPSLPAEGELPHMLDFFAIRIGLSARGQPASNL